MNAIGIMSALAQPTRLAVFSLLARAGAEGMTSGMLAEKTGTPANTMSAHLTILSQAKLVASRRAGRNIFYRALPDAVRQLTVFLIKDCCAGCHAVCDDLEGDLKKCRKLKAAADDQSGMAGSAKAMRQAPGSAIG